MCAQSPAVRLGCIVAVSQTALGIVPYCIVLYRSIACEGRCVLHVLTLCLCYALSDGGCCTLAAAHSAFAGGYINFDPSDEHPSMHVPIFCACQSSSLVPPPEIIGLAAATQAELTSKGMTSWSSCDVKWWFACGTIQCWFCAQMVRCFFEARQAFANGRQIQSAEPCSVDVLCIAGRLLVHTCTHVSAVDDVPAVDGACQHVWQLCNSLCPAWT